MTEGWLVVYGVGGSHHWLLSCEQRVGPDPICTPSVATHSHLPCPLPHPAALLAVRQVGTAPSVLPARPLSSFITWSGAEDPQGRREGLAWLRISSAWGGGGKCLLYLVLWFSGSQRTERRPRRSRTNRTQRGSRRDGLVRPPGRWLGKPPCYLPM